MKHHWPKNKQIFIAYDAEADKLTWRDSHEPKSSRAPLEIPDSDLIERLRVWSKSVFESRVMPLLLKTEEYLVTTMLLPTELVINIEMWKKPRKGRS
jgi:hypothetical protein